MSVDDTEKPALPMHSSSVPGTRACVDSMRTEHGVVLVTRRQYTPLRGGGL